MSNNYNITLSNFVKNSDKMFLHDPAIYIRVWDDTDKLFRPLGYVELKKTWKQTLQYAEFYEGIPESLIRRDIISQGFELSGTLKQIQPETVALLSQRRINTDDVSATRVMIGSSVPSPIFVTVSMVTQTADGKEVRLVIRKGQMSSEDFEIILGDKEYAGVPFKIKALKDDSPITNGYDLDYSGKNTLLSGTFTADSADITFASSTGLSDVVSGCVVVSPGFITTGTTVLSVNPDTRKITMSANAITSGVATVYTEKVSAYSAQDDIAYFKFFV